MLMTKGSWRKGEGTLRRAQSRESAAICRGNFLTMHRQTLCTDLAFIVAFAFNQS